MWVFSWSRAKVSGPQPEFPVSPQVFQFFAADLFRIIASDSSVPILHCATLNNCTYIFPSSVHTYNLFAHMFRYHEKRLNLIAFIDCRNCLCSYTRERERKNSPAKSNKNDKLQWSNAYDALDVIRSLE